MDSAKAAAILRRDEEAYYTPSMLDEARDLGAQSLEAWRWRGRDLDGVRVW